VNSLDHVALWVAGRDSIAKLAVAHLGMHVIDRTERFTLIGSHARRGKLTLFDAGGPRGPGPLLWIGLRVSDLDRARASLPADASRDELDLGEGLRVRLVEAPTDVEYDLDHVALQTRRPAEAAIAWQALGFSEPTVVDGIHRLEAAGAYLELVPGDPVDTDAPLLNHIAVLVDTADDWRARAESAGAEIADVVDAENTYAVFVWGPERVKLEYVEHKPGFSLE
jgi:catechol 2,3-dioxygenase-like lactoylglutathione lyase family enzyme